MSGDYTRFTFDPEKGFSGVLKQQGRVSLDADWNEGEELIDRRLRSGLFDILASSLAPAPPAAVPTIAIVPATTATGFQITTAADGTLLIGAGRAYVDGIQVECFGDPASGAGAVRDPNIGCVHGPAPLSFAQQPFIYAPAYPAAPAGTGIAYLDVWQREVTPAQDGSLLDPALDGRDTATRVQTAWQVKVATGADGATCGDDPEDWSTITAPSTGRLTTIKGPPTPPGGPCIVQGPDGYTGLENRLYRVEVHTAGNFDGSGGAPMPTFKWSRDNASLVAVVTDIDTTGPRPQVTVDSTGRDEWTRFRANDWVEFVNDDIELSMRDTGTGGPLVQVYDVNEATGVITIVATPALNAYNGAVGTNPRLVKWDAAVQAVQPGIAVPLENGISIQFDPEAGSHGDLHAGDFWLCWARTADGSIDVFQDAPPRGPLHHFAKLSVVTAGAAPTDCRTVWPPPATGDGCECEVCVTQTSHAQGTLTIQQAIDRVVAAGGGRVCICEGLYELDQGLEISNAKSVHVHGVGIQTQIRYPGDGPVLAIETSIDISVSDLMLIATRENADGEVGDAVTVSDTAAVTLERLVVLEGISRLLQLLELAAAGAAGLRLGTAVALSGLVAKATIRDCVLVGGTAIGGLTDFSQPLLDMVSSDARFVEGQGARSLVAVELRVRDNLLAGSDYGIQFGRATQTSGGFLLFMDRNEVAHNSFVWSTIAGVDLRPAVMYGSIEINDNTMLIGGSGVLIGSDNVAVEGNEVHRPSGSETQTSGAVGIELVEGAADVIKFCRVIGNRVGNFEAAGIAVDEGIAVESLMIKQNTIEACGSGILMAPSSTGTAVSVANNLVEGITTLNDGDSSTPLTAILLTGATASEIVDNTISRIGQSELDRHAHVRAGIQLVACPSVRVAGNNLSGVGQRAADGWTAAISATLPYSVFDVVDNTVEAVPVAHAVWFALLIGDHLPADTYGIDTVSQSTAAAQTADGQSRTSTSTTGVRGNELRAGGLGLIARLESNDNCTFAENRCVSPQARRTPVTMSVETLALNSNHVLGGEEKSIEVINVRTVRKNVHAFTALGNLTSEYIYIDGVRLAPPWEPLNVVGI